MAQPAWIDATALAQLIAKKKISPLEALDAAITRAEQANGHLNFLTARLYDRARAKAKSPVGNAPFAGVPYLIKDMNAIKGEVSGFGSNCTLMAPPASENSAAIDSIEAAGLTIFGLTAMSEFGYIPATESVRHGPCRNPWGLDYSPGGSSGGAAAAVAAGVVPMADAADGGGSIRIPASNCGLFGLKTSRKRLIGEFPNSTGVDLVVQNPVSVTVRDTANMMIATQRRGKSAPYPELEHYDAPLAKKLRVGLCLTSLHDHQPHPDVVQAVKAAAKLMEELGHHVEETDLPFSGEQFSSVFGALWVKGAYDVNEGIRTLVPGGSLDGLLEPYTIALGDLGAPVDDAMLAASRAGAAQIDAAYYSWFNQFDVILSPVLLTPPPPIGHLDGTLPFAEITGRIQQYCDYTMIQNATGGPAMSVPLGISSEGLPIGVQFAAPLGEDGLLLQLAFELEQARPWSHRHPAIWTY